MQLSKNSTASILVKSGQSVAIPLAWPGHPGSAEHTMESLVQAWQLRVESLSNEISQKRVRLSEVRETTLDLQAVQEEEDRLLAHPLSHPRARPVA